MLRSCRSWSKVVLLAGALVCSGAWPAPGSADPGSADVLVSTADGAVRQEQAQLPAAPADAGQAADVVVDLDAARQRTWGVGAALTESSAHLLVGLPPAERAAVLRELFAPERGGLSVVRLVIGASDFSLDHVSFADAPGADPDLRSFSIDDDRDDVLPVLREILAIAPDVEIVASPWSAPGWMKDTGNDLYGTLLPEHEATFARYLVRYLEAYRAEGIRIGWLTVQNEPAAAQFTYPSMIMSPEQQIRVVRDHLGPALVRAGLDTHVLVWDHNWCDARPPGSCAGPAPASFPLEVLDGTQGGFPIGGTGFHCYGGDQVVANEALHDRWPDLQLWQTECSGGEWQGSRAEAFESTVLLLARDRNHWSNATLLWNLALDPDNGPHLGGCDTCRGVVTVDPAARTWRAELDLDVLAGFARFAPSGSGALASTATSGLESSATCSPTGRPGVVVWNPGDSRRATIRFGGSGQGIDVAVDLRAGSLTSVAAPEGTPCRLAEPIPLPAPTAPSSTSTTAPPSHPGPAPAAPAHPRPGSATYTG
ncbi:MAG: glycosyl hydrolase [Actinobacteria bacterium]|nr:glycosyl hydrolase [Actinomycetota bacterium]